MNKPGHTRCQTRQAWGLGTNGTRTDVEAGEESVTKAKAGAGVNDACSPSLQHQIETLGILDTIL